MYLTLKVLILLKKPIKMQKQLVLKAQNLVKEMTIKYQNKLLR